VQGRGSCFGAHLWCSIAGRAAREPEVVRDLYAFAAASWVESGYRLHFVLAPALPEAIDPWFRLCFGGSAVLAAQTTGPQPPVDTDVEIREGEPDDARA